MNTNPVTKTARHAQIAAILSHKSVPVRSQEELAELLAQRGVRVTQATLSRDLEELGAVRQRVDQHAIRAAQPDRAEFFQITGEGRLGNPHAPLREQLSQLLL